jgi:hypothetical protein
VTAAIHEAVDAAEADTRRAPPAMNAPTLTTLIAAGGGYL